MIMSFRDASKLHKLGVIINEHKEDISFHICLTIHRL